MSVKYTSIRIPKDIAERLTRYRDRLQARRTPEERLGRSATAVSLAEAIERLMDRSDAQTARGKQSKANAARRDIEGQTVFDQCQ